MRRRHAPLSPRAVSPSTAIALVGYSMGGNLVLKLAGELGASTPPPHPPRRRRRLPRASISDLSADALHLSRRIASTSTASSRRSSAASAARPCSSPTSTTPTSAANIRSVREFDERITALYSGFTGADDYYFRAAAARVLDRIAVPTLILHALDDPFIRIMPASCAAIAANPHITLLETAHGGHCAFLASPDPTRRYDGYWAESTLLDFLLAHQENVLSAPASLRVNSYL